MGLLDVEDLFILALNADGIGCSTMLFFEIARKGFSGACVGAKGLSSVPIPLGLVLGVVKDLLLPLRSNWHSPGYDHSSLRY